MISINHHHDILIPLNSFVIDNCGYFSSKNIKDEIFSFGKFVRENFNRKNFPFLDNEIFSNFLSVLKMKIFFGERIILEEFDFLTSPQKEELVNFLKKNNISCFSVVNRDRERNLKYLRFSQLINHTDNIVLCKKIKFNDEYIEKNYNGITVIGDVHGDKEKLLNVIDWAKSIKNFMIFLGDVINHGPHSIECVEIIYELLIRNKCLLILGNHERKLFRILNKNSSFIPVNGNIKENIEKIQDMNEKTRNVWMRKFKTLISHGKLFYKYKNCIFTHGGFCEEILNIENEEDCYFSNKLKNLCIFGEEEINYKKKYDREDFSDVLNKEWIDKIPKDKSLFLGHYQIVDNYPYIKINKNNAKIYFIDTGCGKGGKLSSIDLKFNEEKNLEVKNFNIW